MNDMEMLFSHWGLLFLHSSQNYTRFALLAVATKGFQWTSVFDLTDQVSTSQSGNYRGKTRIMNSKVTSSIIFSNRRCPDLPSWDGCLGIH